MRAFVVPSVSKDDLETLIGMRDGSVHAALSDEVETHLLTVFAQFTGELLDDLGRDRAEVRDRTRFWGDQIAVVDALLADARDQVAHDVEVKLAQAGAYFVREYGGAPRELLELARLRFEPDDYDDDQMKGECPACDSVGLATGINDVEWEPEVAGDEVVGASPTVWFTPSTFECRVCRLRLDSLAEIVTAGMEPRWENYDADWHKYEPVDEDSSYEAYRDRY
jgi:hypothetical protein